MNMLLRIGGIVLLMLFVSYHSNGQGGPVIDLNPYEGYVTNISFSGSQNLNQPIREKVIESGTTTYTQYKEYEVSIGLYTEGGGYAGSFTPIGKNGSAAYHSYAKLVKAIFVSRTATWTEVQYKDDPPDEGVKNYEPEVRYEIAISKYNVSQRLLSANSAVFDVISAMEPELNGALDAGLCEVSIPPLKGPYTGFLYDYILVDDSGKSIGESVKTGGTSPVTLKYNSAASAGLRYYLQVVHSVNTTTYATRFPFTIPADFSITKPANTPPSCAGKNDGKITINRIEGGAGGYSVSVVAAGNTSAGAFQDVTGYPVVLNLPQGYYDVWVRDSRGCIKKVLVSENIPGPLPLSATIVASNVVQPFCDGQPNGSIQFDLSGGKGADYEYAENDAPVFTPITTSGGKWTRSGLPAGTFKFAFRVPGCNTEIPLTQTLTYANLAPVVSVNNIVQPACAGESGRIRFNLTGGGTSGYEYAVDGGAFSRIAVTGGVCEIFNVASGDHAFHFRIAGCNPPATIMTSIDPVPSVITANVDAELKFNGAHITCEGGNDGRLTVSNVQGGTAPGGLLDYLITLTKGATPYTSVATMTTVVFSDLTAGSYTLQIRDKNNCVKVYPVVLAGPRAVAITAISKQDEVCQGAHNGSITAALAGGTDSYIVRLWLEGNERSDAYVQEKILNQTGAVIFTNLPSNIYRLGVKDSKGCPDNWRLSGAMTVSTPSAPLSLSYEAGHADTNLYVTCKGSATGAVKVTATGGWGDYAYSIDGVTYTTGAGDHVFSALPAGTHTLYVKDKLGCVQQCSVTIAEPADELGLAATVTQPSCPRMDDGSVALSSTGGWRGYSFSRDGSTYYSDGAAHNAYTFNGYPDGTYTFYVKDARQCETSISVTINDRPALMTTVEDIAHVSCFSNTTGTITLGVQGGSPPYQLQTLNTDTGVATAWSNSLMVESLGAGTYTTTVRDDAGCQLVISNIEILQPDEVVIVADKVVTPTACKVNDGSIDVSVSGGVGAYTYAWYKGASLISAEEDIHSLLSGAYRLVVKDVNGCAKEKSVAVPDIAAPQIDVNDNTPVTCVGGSDGVVTIEVSGGKAPYSVLWSNGATTLSINGLAAAQYTVEVTDANQCLSIEEIAVGTRPALDVVSTGLALPSCPGMSDGFLEVATVNGSAPFSINWSRDAYDGKTLLEGLSSDTYTVTVTDQDGCRVVKDFMVDDPTPVAVQTLTQSPLRCFNDCDGKLEVQATGGTGPYQYQWTSNQWTTPIAGGVMGDLCAGMYTVTATDVKGCKIARSYAIDNPAEISITPVLTLPTCHGNGDAKIEAQTQRGVAPFTFTWQQDTWPDAVITTRNFIDQLKAGQYNLKVTDRMGCEKSAIIMLDDTAPVEVNFEPEIYLCGGESIALNAGYPGSVYTWTSDKGFSDDQQVVTIGTPARYEVKVVTEKGCAGGAVFEIFNSNELLKANFLLSSHALIGDTVAIIDISHPIPNAIRWDATGNPERFQEPDSYYQEFRYYVPGEYEVTLYAYKGDCTDAVTKKITVYNTQEELENASNRLGFDGLALEQFDLYPNPNSGVFSIALAFSRPANAKLTIMPLDQRYGSYELTGTGEKTYGFDVDISHQPKGIYVLLLEAGELKKTIKFIVH